MTRSIAAVLMLSLALSATAGTAGFAFLSVPAGARSVAMGGAFTAVRGDPMSLYWNPAGIVFVPSQQITTTYTSYMMDMQAGFAGYVSPGDGDAIGVSLNYFYSGSMPRTTMANPTGTGEEFSSSSIAAAGTYGRTITPDITAGVSGRFVYSTIDTYNANGFLVDLGLYYVPPAVQDLTVGLAVRNAGIQTKAFYAENDPMPTEVAVGGSMDFMDGNLLVAADASYPFQGDFNVALGVEYTPVEMFSIRAGGNLHDKNAADEAGGGFVDAMAFGAGARWEQFSLDYAYKPFADLGNAHRISLGIGL
jgi:hypothetical protein